MACWLGEVPVILSNALSPNTANAKFGLPAGSRWHKVGEDGKVALGGKFIFGGGRATDAVLSDFIDDVPSPAAIKRRPPPSSAALLVHIPTPFDAPITPVEYVSHHDVLETMLAWVERGARFRTDDTKLRHVLAGDAGYRPDFIGFAFFVSGLILVAGMMAETTLPAETEKLVCEQLGRIWRILFGELSDVQLGLVNESEVEPACGVSAIHDADSECDEDDLTQGLFPWIKLEGDYVEFIATVPDMRSSTCFLRKGILWGQTSLRPILTEFYIGRLVICKLRERIRAREIRLRLDTLAYREALLKVAYGPTTSTRPSIRLPRGTTVADIEACVPPCIGGILERFRTKGDRLQKEQRILVWPTLFSLVAAAGLSVDSFYESIEPSRERKRTIGEFRSTVKTPERYIVGCAHHSACAACPFTGDLEERSSACLGQLRLEFAARAPIARCIAKLKLNFEEDAMCEPFL